MTTAKRRTVSAVMREVAAELGNTPAVARGSDVDPLVVERYLAGETLDLPATSRPDGPTAERAVLDYLTEPQP